jgi:hypothetical protein
MLLLLTVICREGMGRGVYKMRGVGGLKAYKI